MCLWFVFLLVTRVAAWLRLSHREEAWKTAEILILRHQLAILQRRQPRRPKLNWADRALIATLLGVIPRRPPCLLTVRLPMSGPVSRISCVAGRSPSATCDSRRSVPAGRQVRRPAQPPDRR
jgi:hypothetical protein